MNTITQKKADEARAEKRLKKIKDKKQKAILMLAFAAIVILATGFLYIIPKYQNVQSIKAQIVMDENNIEVKKSEKKKLEDQLEEKNVELEKLKSEFGPKLNMILPDQENIFELTNFLENYATRFHSEENPLILNNINYGNPKKVDQYFVLPVRMNVQASERNFANFLNMIERSGSLEEENYFNSEPIRLMSIENINVSIPKEALEEDESAKKEIAVYPITLEINAYFKGIEDKNKKNNNSKK